MCLLKKACYCLNLRIGALIIGWLGCVYSVLEFLTKVAEITGFVGHKPNDFVLINLVMVTINFVVNSLLIQGARNGNRRYLLPWLSFNGILLFVSIGLGFCYIILGSLTLPQIALTLLSTLVLGVWWLYVWCCIYSYYRELGLMDVLV